MGFAVQALVTRQGPIEGLQSHLSSPFSNNIIGAAPSLFLVADNHTLLSFTTASACAGSIARIPETIGQTGL